MFRIKIKFDGLKEMKILGQFKLKQEDLALLMLNGFVLYVRIQILFES